MALCCFIGPRQDTHSHAHSCTLSPRKHAVLCQGSLQFHSTQQNVFINISLMVDMCTPAHARAPNTRTHTHAVVSVQCTISRFPVQFPLASPVVFVLGPWTRACALMHTPCKTYQCLISIRHGISGVLWCFGRGDQDEVNQRV